MAAETVAEDAGEPDPSLSVAHPSGAG